VTDYSTNTEQVVQINTDCETYLRLLALYNSRPDFSEHPKAVEQVVRNKCEGSLQLSIFTLEQEFASRSKPLGEVFESFFSNNRGRVCLDAMASRDVHNATVREIKNLIAKAKSKAASEARCADQGARVSV